MKLLPDNDLQTAGHLSAGQRPRDYFGMMLAISLALHVISSIILLAPRQGTITLPTISYLDLKNISIEERVMTAPTEQPPAEETREAFPDPAAAEYPEAAKFEQDIRTSMAEARTDPEALRERSFSLGLSSGYFSSIASGETLRDSIRDYYFMMLREINEKWWLNSGSRSGGWRGAIVEVVVARNGTIVDKVLVRSSGNRSFDRAIMATLDQADPLPPLPGDYQPEYFRAPLRFVAPLNLFGS
jgi:protein TonB